MYQDSKLDMVKSDNLRSDTNNKENQMQAFKTGESTIGKTTLNSTKHLHLF